MGGGGVGVGVGGGGVGVGVGGVGGSGGGGGGGVGVGSGGWVGEGTDVAASTVGEGLGDGLSVGVAVPTVGEGSTVASRTAVAPPPLDTAPAATKTTRAASAMVVPSDGTFHHQGSAQKRCQPLRSSSSIRAPPCRGPVWRHYTPRAPGRGGGQRGCADRTLQHVQSVSIRRSAPHGHKDRAQRPLLLASGCGASSRRICV